jgi:predicted  nucleic acid-binding Zn-ribbon protein
MVKDKQKILELERDNRTLKKQVSRLSSEVDTLNVKTKELSERPPTQSIIVV